MRSGPILLIDDDADDKDIFLDILQELQITNLVIWFQDCESAFSHLQETKEQPFIIFCDLNLPGVSGIECKRRIDEHKELRKKSIPFVFFSTTTDQTTVNEAYTQMTVQGFFRKPSSFSELKNLVRLITDYWDHCKHPNSNY
jgi:CheY-like chemotaxis protein